MDVSCAMIDKATLSVVRVGTVKRGGGFAFLGRKATNRQEGGIRVSLLSCTSAKIYICKSWVITTVSWLQS